MGKEAQEARGKTTEDVMVLEPLKNSVMDFEVAQSLMDYMIKTVAGNNLIAPRW